MSSQNTQSDRQDALNAYGNFPFDSDESYQQGLASILAGGSIDVNTTPEVRQEMIRRVRVFYFNKTSVYSITVDEAREYEQSRGSVASASATSTTNAPVEVDEETRVLTFAELKELIESGKVDQIPNNKVIPEAINEAPPSQSTVGIRKKPWELADSQS